MEQLLSISIPMPAFLSYLVFMCAVSALPRPAENANQFYIFIYRFMHLLCMNLRLFMDPTKKLRAFEEETVS